MTNLLENKDVWILEWLESNICLREIVWLHNKSISDTLLLNNFASWKYMKIERTISYLISISKDIQNFFEENPNCEIFFNIEKGFYWKDWEKLKDTPEWKFLQEWFDYIKPKFEKFKKEWEWKHIEDYLDFWNWIIYWALGWIWVWVWADLLWLAQNNVVEWVVRFLSGNWDTIWWLIQRIKNKIKWWKDNVHLDSFSIWWVAWMWFWPTLQSISQITWNSWNLASTIYTSAYSNADNLFSWIWTLWMYIKDNWIKLWIKEFWSQPFQKANIIIIATLFILNLIFHIISNDFIDDQTKAAIHWTILNIDSIVAALYMRYYAAQKYKNFILDIWNKDKIRQLAKKYNIES